MKISLIFCGMLLFSVAARAQEAPQNGYETLVAAGKLILSGENGGPSSTETGLSPEENLRRERVAVERNAPALHKLREALALPIALPLAKNYGDLNFSNRGRFRELARQLVQESDVRLANGDFAGAMNSRLDCIEMGAAVSRGSITSMLVGVAIESIGHRDIAKVAEKLDGAQCLAAATRLVKIEARRPTFAEVLRLEGQESLRLTLSILPDEKTRAELLTQSGRKNAKMGEKTARQLLSLTPEKVREGNARLFGAAIGAARVSPRIARLVPLPDDLDSQTLMGRGILQNPALRFLYERSVAQNRLLQSALELRAQKLKNGAYAKQFQAPRDPFAPDSRLIYRREGETYRLYSVGPDGKDNGGRAIVPQQLVFDADSGTSHLMPAKSVHFDSRGDLVAPVF